MTNNLKAKSQEFMELGKKITQGEWDIDLEDGFVAGTHTNGVALVIRPSTRDANGHSVCSRASAIDWEALNNLPEFFTHIAELQKVVDDYEEKLKELRRLSGNAEDTADMGTDHYLRWKVLEQAVSIMEGEQNEQ